VTRIRRGELEVELLRNETVLDALLRAGANPLYSCRVGACLTCLSRATAGRPPAESQEPLGKEERRRGHFLPCVAVPTENLTIEPLL